MQGFDPDRDLLRIGLANQTTMLRNETLSMGKMFEKAMMQKYGPAELKQHYMVMDTICDATQVSLRTCFSLFLCCVAACNLDPVAASCFSCMPNCHMLCLRGHTGGMLALAKPPHNFVCAAMWVVVCTFVSCYRTPSSVGMF